MHHRIVVIALWALGAQTCFLVSSCESGEVIEEAIEVEMVAASVEPSNPWPLFHDTIGFSLYYDRDFWERANAEHLPDGLGAVVMHSRSRREVLRIVVRDRPEETPLPARLVEHARDLTSELPRFERLGEEDVVVSGLQGRRLDYTFLSGMLTWRMSECHIYADDRYFILILGAEEDRWGVFEPRVRAITASFHVTYPRAGARRWTRATQR